jgi:ubiquinone/menaquinone biosynthesis C-methylase UbiE
MSVSFDRIASRYNATRGFPPGVDAQLAAAFRRLSHLPAGARLLEVGVGTGRIALPLAEAGYPYVGVDLSRNMMTRLQERLHSGLRLTLVQGDATQLPLRDASVDGAVAVHVFHLIAGWEQAVAELRRVIRPGGILATGFNKQVRRLPSDQLREQWSVIAGELGGTTKRPGARIAQEEPLLVSLFGPARQDILATWVRRESLRHQLDLLATRTTSDTWQLSDSVLSESIARAEDWARNTFGDLELQHTTEVHFVMVFYGAPPAP